MFSSRKNSLGGLYNTVINPSVRISKTTPPKWRPFDAPGKFLWPTYIKPLLVTVMNFID